MKTEDRSKVLRARVTDHLYAQGFTDDLMYVHTVITFDGKVMIRLFPFAYGCTTCETKGFLPKLADAFIQRIRPSWCADCMRLTELRWERTRELTPRLKTALELAFEVTETNPDSPRTGFLVCP